MAGRMNKGMYSSETDTWSTPQDFFDKLDVEFHFTLDAAATRDNTKCKKFFSPKDDALVQSWDNEIVFCNPPYGSGLKHWVKKASEARGGVVVLFIPARPDTTYFHDYIYNKPGVEIRFLRGRIKFGGQVNSAPFPSMLVIFRKEI